MNRFLSDLIVDKPKEINTFKYFVYQNEVVLKGYRNNLKTFRRNNPHKEIPLMWINFANFTSWYKMRGFPFLLDKQGELLLPWDTSDIYNLCPSKPNSLITKWQRKVLSFEPKARGGNKNVGYMVVDDYITGEVFKFKIDQGFNLEKFKKQLVFNYFRQVNNITLFNTVKVKSIEQIFKEVKGKNGKV